MKKTALLVIFSFVFSGSHLFAQGGTAFDKGTVVATVGYGFPEVNRTSGMVHDPFDRTKVSGFGPLLVKGDYGIVKFKWGHSVGAGIVLGYSNTTVRFDYKEYSGPAYRVFTQTDSYSTITVGARGTYHFFTNEKLDCYVSIGLGSRIKSEVRSVTDDPNGPISVHKSSLLLYSGAGVGIRYYFTKNIGVYSELGWDLSTPIQGGLALKF